MDQASTGQHSLLFKGPMVLAVLDGSKSQTRRVVTAHNSLLDGKRVGRQGPARKAWEGLDWSTARVEEGKSSAGEPGPCFRVHCPSEGAWHQVHPIYQAGHELWGRETWAELAADEAASPVHQLRNSQGRPARIIFRADDPTVMRSVGPGVGQLAKGDRPASGWRPAIHMPRWASRLHLVLTLVRAGRVQDIDEADAKAEGAAPGFEADAADFIGNPNWRPQSTYRLGFKHLWDSINAGRGYGWQENPPVWCLRFAVKQRAA